MSDRLDYEDLVDPEEVEMWGLQLVEQVMHFREGWGFDGLRAVYIKPESFVVLYSVEWADPDYDLLDDESIDVSFEREWSADFFDVVRAMEERDDVTRFK